MAATEQPPSSPASTLTTRSIPGTLTPPTPTDAPPSPPTQLSWGFLGYVLLIVLGPALWALGLPLLLVVPLVLLIVVLVFTPRRLALILLVPAVAMLLAAFPARNSELWMHLTYGKLLARGEISPGTEPFAYTTTAAPWINHAWFADWLGYIVYLLGHGPALIMAKALLIGALGCVLLALGWVRESPALSAACALLALLALGGGIPLHPMTISCLFLGLTLWLLERNQRLQSRGDNPSDPALRAVAGAVRLVGQSRRLVHPRADYGWPVLGRRKVAARVGGAPASRPESSKNAGSAACRCRVGAAGQPGRLFAQSLPRARF